MAVALPVCINRGRSLLFVLLPRRRSTSSAAGSAVIAATHQVTTWTQVSAATVAARAKHAGWSKRHGLVRGSGGPKTTQVIAANLARSIVWWRRLLSKSTKVASISTAHGWSTTTATAGLLAHAFHLGLLLRPCSLYKVVSSSYLIMKWIQGLK